MTPAESASFTIMVVVAVVLLLGGIVVLGIGAQVWAKALSLAVNARLHGKQVDAFGAPSPEAHEEPDGPVIPKLRGTGTDLSSLTGDDIEAAILAARTGRGRSEAEVEDDEFDASLRTGEVQTTDGNSGYDYDEPPVPGRPVVGAG